MLTPLESPEISGDFGGFRGGPPNPVFFGGPENLGPFNPDFFGGLQNLGPFNPVFFGGRPLKFRGFSGDFGGCGGAPGGQVSAGQGRFVPFLEQLLDFCENQGPQAFFFEEKQPNLAQANSATLSLLQAVCHPKKIAFWCCFYLFQC